MQPAISKYLFLFTAIWYAGNGTLHDIFVIVGHKEKYNRELLRLLMDGHVLILSGAVMFLCYLMAARETVYAPVIAMITAFFMVVYCVMIFPFLKSFGTIAISIVVIAVGIQMLMAGKQIS